MLDIKDNVQLYKGDCLEIMKDVPDKSVDMILCDLPYGKTNCKWDIIIPFEPLWEQYNRVINKNGAIVLFASQPFTTKLINSNINNYKYSWVWDKEVCGSFALAKIRPMVVTEDICVFSSIKGKIKYYPQMEDADPKTDRGLNKGTTSSEAVFNNNSIAKSSSNYNIKLRYPKNIIKYSKFNAECNSSNRVHPTQKPVAILEYLIKTYTKENEVILDNCMGSGSTGVACINTGRKFIGIEKDDKYFDVACNRINKFI